MTEINVVLAKDIAERIHKDQKYGELPYMVHVEAVAQMTLQTAITESKLMQELESLLAVAYLHDVLEDTTGAVEELLEELEQNFPEQVVEAVKCISKNFSVDREDYIKRVVGNPLAAVVKMLDACCNWTQNQLEGNTIGMAKYTKFINDLVKESERGV